MANQQHKGWHSRGYLPHCDEPFQIQTITFRLADSLPKEVIRKLEQELPAGCDSEKRKRIEEYLNNGYGSCHLSNPLIAGIVEGTLLEFDGQRYRLMAWAVMPNHVHVVVEMIEGFRLDKIMHSWKSYTAKAANKILGGSGRFWFPDYYDRFVRDADHLENAVNYVHWNPVKAKLVERPEDWPFSSARFQEM